MSFNNQQKKGEPNMFTVACYLNEIVKICLIGLVLFMFLPLSLREDGLAAKIVFFITVIFCVAGLILSVAQLFIFPCLWITSAQGIYIFLLLATGPLFITFGLIFGNNPMRFGGPLSEVGEYVLTPLGVLIAIPYSLYSTLACDWHFYFSLIRG